ncbi:hypothetical protein SLEP1_g49262 [Rubroshorea leprosula]|uniref:Uncharacterized protein n=1 Tax=Rubroshorea leprosula TaxID=152421 RepID=A0AAV5LYB1_9ROSI|nr:hypothetical protein SLEP1_g49262 [Rubroshorea leprosula]
MIMLVAMLMKSSIDLLLKFSRASKSTTYPSATVDASDKAGCTILQFCIIINNSGMLVVYMIINEGYIYNQQLRKPEFILM